MPIARNVVRRRGSLNYYARATIPKELRAAFGRREIWKSLGTPDRKEAIARSYAVFADIERQFAIARRRKKPGPDDLSRAVMNFEWLELEGDLAERRKWLTEREFNDEEARIYKSMAEGEAQSARLIGESIQQNPAFLTLRKIEAAREIAGTVAASNNRVFLDAESLLLNLRDDGGAKKK